MSDFQINDGILQRECDELAREIVDDFRRERPGEDLSDYQDRGDFSDRVHEVADGHEWVIYNHKALMICAHCDVSEGEAFLEEVGMPENPTIYSLACMIAYGEMRARIESEIGALLEREEDDESEESEE